MVGVPRIYPILLERLYKELTESVTSYLSRKACRASQFGNGDSRIRRGTSGELGELIEREFTVFLLPRVEKVDQCFAKAENGNSHRGGSSAVRRSAASMHSEAAGLDQSVIK